MKKISACWIFFLLLVFSATNVFEKTSAQNSNSSAIYKDAQGDIPAIFADIFTKIFHADGTAKNTEKLSGLKATNFLGGSDVCAHPQSLLGFDENGAYKCGTLRPSKMLVYLREGSVSVAGKKYSVSRGEQKKLLGDFSRGDLPVTTDAANRAVLEFEDRSLVRMDTDTKIKLSYTSSSDAKTIAQVVIGNSGVLWGRVLGKDGVDFSNGSVLAGVRGTSIKMGPWSMTVVTAPEKGVTIIPKESGSANLFSLKTGKQYGCQNNSFSSNNNAQNSHKKNLSPMISSENSIIPNAISSLLPDPACNTVANSFDIEAMKKDITYMATMLLEEKQKGSEDKHYINKLRSEFSDIVAIKDTIGIKDICGQNNFFWWGAGADIFLESSWDFFNADMVCKNISNIGGKNFDNNESILGFVAEKNGKRYLVGRIDIAEIDEKMRVKDFLDFLSEKKRKKSTIVAFPQGDGWIKKCLYRENIVDCKK